MYKEKSMIGQKFQDQLLKEDAADGRNFWVRGTAERSAGLVPV